MKNKYKTKIITLVTDYVYMQWDQTVIQFKSYRLISALKLKCWSKMKISADVPDWLHDAVIT